MKEIVKIREVNDIEYKNTEKLNKAKISQKRLMKQKSLVILNKKKESTNNFKN